MTFFRILSIVALAGFVTGCETYQSAARKRNNADYYATQQLQKSQQQSRKQIQGFRKELDAVYDDVARITNHLNGLQDNNSVSSSSINSLKQNLSSVIQQNKELRTEISMLKQQMYEQKSQVESMLDKIVKQVASETDKAISGLQSELVRQQRVLEEQSRASASTGGSFYEYKVQPGATLGAIAKAYKVSVSDIKKANNLKNDRIRSGQKLRIPKR